MSKYINLFERNFVFVQRSFNDLNQLIKIAHVFKNEPIGHETQNHIEALLKHTQALEQSNLTILRNLSKLIEILEGNHHHDSQVFQKQQTAYSKCICLFFERAGRK